MVLHLGKASSGGRTSVLLLASILVVLSFSLPAAAREGDLTRLPILGWNTWCTGGSCHQEGATGSYHDVCHEEEIKEIANTMISSGMQALGYRYVNLDDCWLALERDSEGRVQPDPQRFPSSVGGAGFKPMADWLHERGMKFGIYLSAGNWTCSAGSRKTSNPGAPGSFGHYEQDAATAAAWGVDLIKLDWCSVESHQSSKEAYTTAFVDAMNKTGRPMFSNFHCDGDNATWCRREGNSARISHDHHDIWSNTIETIDVLKGIAKYAGCRDDGTGCFANDPDFLMTGGAGCDEDVPGKRCPGQTPAEYRTEVTLWTVAAAQMLVSTDLRNMSALQEELLLNPEVIGVSQDPMFVAGGIVAANPGCASGGMTTDPAVLARTGDDMPLCQVWARPLVTKATAVALFNADDSTHTVRASLKDVGISASSCAVRDLWKRQDLGRADSVSASLTAHDSALFTFSDCQ